MALTETYVNPAIAGDSGTGTIGDPYGDVQYALNTMTRDSTNGDRINIKTGTDEILGAALDLSTYGTPASTAQLIFQGYTTAAGDGGIGGISGAATYAIFADSGIDYVSLIDLHLHNCGANYVVYIDNNSSIVNCEIDTCTAGAGVRVSNNSQVVNCYIHNIGGYGIYCGGGIIVGNYLENGANKFSNAIYYVSSNMYISWNIFNLDSSSNGISVLPYKNPITIENNTIYSSSGTGTGLVLGSNADGTVLIRNNYIEGFSGAGGKGFDITAGLQAYLYSNRAYNNTTNFDTANALVDSDNSATAASALTNPGAGDFSVGTDLKAGAYPTSFKGSSTNQYMDIGAAQRQEPAGGGGGRRPRIRAHGV